MTEALQIWLFAGGFGLIGVLFVLQWSHVRHCKAVGEAIVRLDQTLMDLKESLIPRMERIQDRSHNNQNSIMTLSGRVAVLEERTK